MDKIEIDMIMSNDENTKGRVHNGTTLDSESSSNLKITFHQGFRDFLPMHTHTFWEFFIVTKGSFQHELNGKKEILHQGDAYLIRPWERHEIKQNEPDSICLFLTITIPNMKAMCNICSDDLYEVLYSHDVLKCFLTDHQVRKIMDLCFYIQKNIYADPKKGELPSSLLLQRVLSIVIDQNYSFEEDKPAWLLQLLKDIQDPANKGWHVNDVMSHVNYSHSHVSRFFQRYMNCSVIDYLSEIKMQNAKDLMLYSDLTVYEISEALGYKSSTNFSAVFKAAFGLSPAQYRKKHRDARFHEGDLKDLQ